jgi:hypothetical protein
VVPGGTIAKLGDVSGGGSGSAGGKDPTFVRKVSVAMKGKDNTSNSCPSGATSNPTDVRLVLVDDDGGMVLDQTKKSVVCTSGETTYVKFIAEFTGPENCKDSVAPVNISRGDIDVSVTTTPDNGSLNVTRTIVCRGGKNKN